MADLMKNIKNKELELWYQWNDTGSNSKKLELMKSLTPIVEQQVNKFKGSGLPDTALRLETKRIVSDAIETYDPTKSQLNTHVINYSKKLSRFVQNYQNVGKIPEPRARLIGLYNTLYENLEADKGREPTVLELSDAMNIRPIEIERLQLEQRKDLGMPDLGGDADEGGFFDLTQYSEDDYLKNQAIEFVYYDSEPVDKKILEYVFPQLFKTNFSPITDKEIALKLNLTPANLKKRKTVLAQKIREAYPG